jgi:UPF0716 protein FxsA
MLAKLILLFTVIPLVEIILLIEIGSRLGTGVTLLLLLGTALLGAALARHEGLKTLWRVQTKLANGMMPDEELLDGLLILVAGVMLLAPGLLTDVLGVVLLIPGSRRVIKRWLRHFFRQRLQAQYRSW